MAGHDEQGSSARAAVHSCFEFKGLVSRDRPHSAVIVAGCEEREFTRLLQEPGESPGDRREGTRRRLGEGCSWEPADAGFEAGARGQCFSVFDPISRCRLRPAVNLRRVPADDFPDESTKSS